MAVKQSYLPTFPDDKAKILAVGQSKLYWDLLCYILLLIPLILSLIIIYNKFVLNPCGLSDENIVPFTKNENDSSV